MNHRTVPPNELHRVVDPTPVECIGGPNDGEFVRADENGCRPNGMYVVVNRRDKALGFVVAAKLYVPR